MKRKILVAFATEGEAAAFLKTTQAHPCIPGLRYRFSMGEILITGVGCLRAATAVAGLLCGFDEVWNMGIAGTLNNGLSVGAVVEIQSVSKHLSFPDDIDSHSHEVSSKVFAPLSVSDEGKRLITSDYPIYGGMQRLALASKADVIDMEGYGIATAAYLYGKPCRFWKVVSDHANLQEYHLIKKQMPAWSEKMATVLNDVTNGL